MPAHVVVNAVDPPSDLSKIGDNLRSYEAARPGYEKGPWHKGLAIGVRSAGEFHRQTCNPLLTANWNYVTIATIRRCSAFRELALPAEVAVEQVSDNAFRGCSVLGRCKFSFRGRTEGAPASSGPALQQPVSRERYSAVQAAFLS